jgi:predicted RNA-binding Zn ribbon-like protein
MLELTWEWIAIYEPAFDVANTVAVEKGLEHDLLAIDDEYERWAAVAARSPDLSPDEAAAVASTRAGVFEVRAEIRRLFAAAAAGERLPRRSIDALNRVSRAAPEWLELRPDGTVERRAEASAAERLVARYARSAMEVATDGAGKLRVCGAPSCGMFYRPRRPQQRWCSEPCGNRARFARHYARRGR